MGERIQQIQSLLITGNKKQYYFKPPHCVVQTSTALTPLSLTAIEDSSYPTCVILPYIKLTHRAVLTHTRINGTQSHPGG